MSLALSKILQFKVLRHYSAKGHKAYIHTHMQKQAKKIGFQKHGNLGSCFPRDRSPVKVKSCLDCFPHNVTPTKAPTDFVALEGTFPF